MKTILLAFDADTLSEEQLSQVRAQAPEAKIMLTLDRDEIKSVLEKIETAAGWFPVDLLHQDVFELAGKTMVLVGVGAIGRRTAQVASAMGMHVLGVRRNPTMGASDFPGKNWATYLKYTVQEALD